MICLFGGTFDPVHQGHVHAARAVFDALRLDSIRMLLSARPGHRGEPGASVEDRWRMLQLVCDENPGFIADATEVERAETLGRPSYTVETLEQIRAAAPDEPLLWVLGSDAYRELPTWHRWRELPELTHLVVLRRPGAALELPGELAAMTRARMVTGVPSGAAGSVTLLEHAMPDISATRVRSLLAAGGSVSHLLPAAVYTYIKRHGLYGVMSDL